MPRFFNKSKSVAPRHGVESARRTWIANLLLCAASLLLGLGLLEMAVRIVDGEYGLKNFLAEQQTLFTSAYPSQYDQYLGWIPREGFAGRQNVWRTEVTIGRDGIRSNGPDVLKPAPGAGPVLAVGDSYTFGDEVADHETWPAVLEKLLGRRVINGGVFGYGLDQIYLRAEQLIGRYKPDTLIFSFIPDDISRCELSERTAVHKPFFAIDGDRLVLQNSPVPRPSQRRTVGHFRHLSGYSYLVHKLMMRSFPGYWLAGLNWLKDTRAHSDGEEVAYRLFGKLAELARNHQVKVYVLVQYPGPKPRPVNLRKAERLLARLGEAGLQVIDLWPELVQYRDAAPDQYREFFGQKHHMSFRGNYWVAKKLAAAMER